MKLLFLLGALVLGVAGCTTVSRHVDEKGVVHEKTTTVVPAPVIVPVTPRTYAPTPYYAPQPYYVPPPRGYYYYDRWGNRRFHSY